MTSTLEAAWESRPTPDSAIVCLREEAFDRHSGLFYSPTQYVSPTLTDAQVVVPPRDEASVGSALAEFVRDEFGRTGTLVASPPPPIVTAGQEEAPLEMLADQLVASVETELLYGGSFEQFAKQVADLSIPERLHALFCHEAFGRRENADGTPLSWYINALKGAAGAPRALWLAVPGLPYRDQNPLRVANPPDVVTLAEALFLARLHAISLAVYQVVAGGLHVVVLSDGPLYAETLGVEPEAAAAYLRRVRSLRDNLNMQGTVSILDYQSLVDGAAVAAGVSYPALVDEITAIIEAECDSELWVAHTAHRHLVSGVRWNINWNALTPKVDLDEVWRLLTCPVDEFLSSAVTNPVCREIVQRSNRYAAMNIGLRFLTPVTQLLPGCLRGTMHPKPGQIGLPRLGSVFPWNGVAVVSGDVSTLSPTEVRIDPLFRLATTSNVYVPIIDPDRGPTPIAYRIVS